MTDIIRDDRNADSRTAARPVTDQNASNEGESRTLVTPPPALSPSASGMTTSHAATGAAVAREEERMPLFSSNETNNLRARWDTIQAGFVDEPRKAVQEADALVSSAAKRLSEIFTSEREKLEGQWDRGDISTEDLRVALRRYRSFFTRILSI